MTSPTNSIAQETGYSLVEVMVAMVVLTIAIIPMVGMFDAAMGAADASGAYDEARTCAVQKLEQVKSLAYETVERGLPDGACRSSAFGYTTTVRPIGTDLGGDSGEEGLLLVTITVDRGGENYYNVAGVMSRW